MMNKKNAHSSGMNIPSATHIDNNNPTNSALKGNPTDYWGKEKQVAGVTDNSATATALSNNDEQR